MVYAPLYSRRHTSVLSKIPRQGTQFGTNMSYEYAEEEDDDDVIVIESVPLVLYMFAGCIAGAIETTTMWPFEYIKTQLQLQRQLIQRRNKSADEEKKDGILVMTSDEEDAERPYTDMFSGFVYTVRVYGFWALYGGLAPTLIGSIPKAGIRFGLDAWLNDLFTDDEGQISIFSLFIAGVVAGVVEALVIVAPVETIKTKCIELNTPFLKGLREILLTEGIGGIYHGVLATVLKQGSVSLVDRRTTVQTCRSFCTTSYSSLLLVLSRIMDSVSCGITCTNVFSPMMVKLS